MWRVPLGERSLKKDYIIAHCDVPETYHCDVWAGMVNTAYRRCQQILKKQISSGKSLEDYRFITRRHISLENIKGRNIKPPPGLTLEKYCEALNLAYRQGQGFLFDDLENEQVQRDEELAMLLAADEFAESEQQKHADAELAKKLDHSWNVEVTTGNKCPSRTPRKAVSAGQKDEILGTGTPKHSFEKGLDQIKGEVLKEAHLLLEEIFTKTFDTKIREVAKTLRTHEVYVAANALREFGSVLTTDNLCLALVNSETGEYYAGFKPKDSASGRADMDPNNSGGVCRVPKMESNSDHNSAQAVSGGGLGFNYGSQTSNRDVSHQIASANVPLVSRVSAPPFSSAFTHGGEASLSDLVVQQQARQQAHYLPRDGVESSEQDKRQFPGGSSGVYAEERTSQEGAGMHMGVSVRYRETFNTSHVFPSEMSYGHSMQASQTEGESVSVADHSCISGPAFPTHRSTGEASDDESVEPFQQEFDARDFDMAIKSPTSKRKAGAKQSTQKAKKLATGTPNRDIAPEAMNAMAESKMLQINLAIETLKVKRTNDNASNLYPSIESLNRKPSRGPSNPHSFYKIIAKYFPDLASVDEMVVPNVLRERIATFAMENFQYLQVKHYATILKINLLTSEVTSNNYL